MSEILNEKWIKRRDGEHNGRPRYEYTAIHDGIKYHIVWAIGVGFGYSISFAEGGRRPPGVHRTISWAGTLKRCKEACEKFAASVSKAEAA